MPPLLFVLVLLFLTPASTLDFRYHSNQEMEQYLLQVNASNPDIAHLYSIGQSVLGNDTPAATSCPTRCVQMGENTDRYRDTL
uniref:Uncharacterized protein n=1 Tax=Stegastes partitus TaxID=144197 RepID=A0A3B5B2I9_9TELE